MVRPIVHIVDTSIVQNVIRRTTLIMIDIPRLMKGLEKSMTCSLSAVIVSGAMARSASLGNANNTE